MFPLQLLQVFQGSIYIPAPIASTSIYIPAFKHAQRRLILQSAPSQHVWGLHCKGIAWLNISPHESVENARCMVSVSSTRQPFVRICEGKQRLTMQKELLTKPSIGFTTSLDTNHQRNAKIVYKMVEICEKKVSKSFKGTIVMLTRFIFLVFDSLCCKMAMRKTNEDVRRW